MSVEEEEQDPERSGDTLPATGGEEPPPRRGPGRPRKLRNGNGAPAGKLDDLLGKKLAPFRSVSEVAQSLEVDTEVLDQGNPTLRERATFEPTVPVEDQSDDIIRTYDDLLVRFPFDSGQYYIVVDRKKPLAFQGVPIAGVQTPVRRAWNFEQFIDHYGGGEYVLTVYGPPARGPQSDHSGMPIIKALTKPIKVTVPLSLPPNVDAAMHGENDMEARTAVATNATARMHEVDVQAELEMDERRTKKEREDKAERERLVTEKQRGELNAAQLIQQQHERELMRLERIGSEQKEEAERRMEEIKHQQTGNERLLTQLLTQHKSAPEDISRLEARITVLTEAHQKELTRLGDVHREDIKRLTEQSHAEVMRQRDENKAERDRLDARMKDVEDRATGRIREAEQRSESRIKEVEERARNQVADAERSFNQRLQDQHQQAQNRMTDEARNHERDLRQQQQAFEMRIESQRGTTDAQTTIKDQELARLRSELEEARKKANQPIAERIAEVTEAAEALGMRPAGDGDEGPQDWKSMAMAVAQSVATRLPELVTGAGEMYKALRAPQPGYSQQQQAVMARDAAARARSLAPGMPAPRAALPRPQPMVGFATDDGPAFTGVGGAPPVYEPPPPPLPVAPIQAPMPPPAPAPAVIVPHEPLAAAHPATPSVAAPSVPPPSSAPAATESAAPAMEGAVHNLTLDQLLEVEGTLIAAMNSATPPEKVAEFFAAQLGPERLQTIMGQVSPEQIQQTLRQVGKGNSPLCRREGKKFLEQLWRAIKRISK